MQALTDGYLVESSPIQKKRFCQTLSLKDDPALIQEYQYWHAPENRWPEIPEGIRAVGILDMEIYLHGNLLFMIIETPVDFEWEAAFAKLASLNRQAEWEEFMSRFQQSVPGATSAGKWKLMSRIFKLFPDTKFAKDIS